VNEDIVERLHRMAGLGLVNSGLMEDAAREIERLRETNDVAAIAYADMMVALVQIRSGSPPTHDEIARLIDRAQRARLDAEVLS